MGTDLSIYYLQGCCEAKIEILKKAPKTKYNQGAYDECKYFLEVIDRTIKEKKEVKENEM